MYLEERVGLAHERSNTAANVVVVLLRDTMFRKTLCLHVFQEGSLQVQHREQAQHNADKILARGTVGLLHLPAVFRAYTDKVQNGL